MPDISLCNYNITDRLSAYNAAHKYRFASRLGMDSDSCLHMWRNGKRQVLQRLEDALKVRFNADSNFAVAYAPSRTINFLNDIKGHLNGVFFNAVDISCCFSKADDFKAAEENNILTIEELRTRIFLDHECFTNRMGQEVNKVLLLDDVYANGNTLRGMAHSMLEVNNTLEIVTAVILTI